MSGLAFVRALAPAKVNLRLEVLGARDDGYHDVRTWMLAVDLCDRVEARPNARGDVAIVVRGERADSDVPEGPGNLACRGAQAALDAGRRLGAIGAREGVDLALEKRIPSRAGLGGGSSDAAAAWLATAAVQGLELDAAERDRALASIGSDCVFFAGAGETGFARCEGRGERVTPSRFPIDAVRVAVVTPGTECPTAAVYAALRRMRGIARGPAEPALRRGATDIAWTATDVAGVRVFLANDLEAAALEAFPDLRNWRRLLDEVGAGAWRLSGSGSSFFGIHTDSREAEAELERVRAAARERGLPIRGTWVLPPAGHGARFLELR